MRCRSEVEVSDLKAELCELGLKNQLSIEGRASGACHATPVGHPLKRAKVYKVHQENSSKARFCLQCDAYKKSTMLRG